jgi:hypothetical protein
MGHKTAGALQFLAPALLLAAIAAAAHPHPHGAAPVSPIAGGQGGGGAASDLDLFTDVAAWQDLDFYRLFFFAGGGRGAHSGHIQGGMAAALYPLYVAAFFNGDLFSGSGGAADRDNPAWQGTANQTGSETVWNDDLVLFLGSDLLGAFRFNLLFDGMEFVSHTEKDGIFYDYRAPFLTSLQWGRRFGSFSAGITAGIGWGGYESWSETWETESADTAAETGVATTTIQNYTTAGIKLEAAYGSFAADYQISLSLGREETLSGASSRNGAKRIDLGAVEHLANLYYNTAIPIAEGMSLSLRPRLLLGFYHNDYETALEGGAYEKLRSFSFSPMLDAELGWQITEKLFFATYLSLSAFTANFARTDSGSYWEVAGLALDSDESGSLDFRFAFSKSFVLEAGIEGLFDFSGARYVLDFANLRGAFALIFKPGM